MNQEIRMMLQTLARCSHDQADKVSDGARGVRETFMQDRLALRAGVLRDIAIAIENAAAKLPETLR